MAEGHVSDKIDKLVMRFLSHYQKKTVLVTGGAGYIGSSVIRKLSTVPCNIIVLDRKGSKLNFPSERTAKISIYKADIRNKETWNNLLGKVDILFHFAAQTSSKMANENPFLDAEINLLPIINIVETCQKNNFSPDIVFSGTVTQVGLTKAYPVNEEFKDQPITVYDINKLAGEKYLQYYSNQLSRRVVILRLANVYGPGPRSSSADRGILNLFVRKALRGEPITIYGEGNFVRDYIYIDDVANAFLTAGAKMKVLSGNYYVIGSGFGHTIKEMAGLVRDQVAQKTGKKVKIIHVPLPKGLSPIEFRNFVADSTKFIRKTGWKARISLLEGIKRTIDYFIKEEES